MSKRIFAAIAAIVWLIGTANAQIPDNDFIFAEINSTASQYYYPNLMMRYEAGDALTDNEYHFLYYGYAFQPQYKPLDAAQDAV